MIQIAMQTMRKTASQTVKNTLAQIIASLSKDRYFFLFAMSFLLVKLILMKDVTIYAITTAFADDQLMVHIAEKLLRLNWLGGYNHYTLAKGCFFPFFLAVGKFFHIDFISWVQIFYAISCYLFLKAIRPVIRFQWTIYPFYLLMLFHPIMASSEVIQRVYRNSITPAQVLLIFGGQFGFYLRYHYDKRFSVKWALVTTCGFISLWFSREDTIWVVPFLAVSAAVIFLQAFAHGFFHNITYQKRIRYTIILLLPFLALPACRLPITLINGVVYNSWTDNELAHGAFPKAMKALYAIDMEEPAPYTSISREKIEKVYEISPTLASIQNSLDAVMDLYATQSGRIEENKKNGNVENGWFFWALRDAVQLEGYYTDGQTANKFYQSVYDEVETAFKNGKLKRQATMPSALMPPWKSGMLGTLVSTMAKADAYVSSENELFLLDRIAVDDGGDGITRFEWITGRHAVRVLRSTEPLTDSALLTDSSSAVNINSNFSYRFFNSLADIFRSVSGLLALIGKICFLILLVLFFLKKAPQNAAILLMLSGIAGGLLCLYAGVAYNELRSCSSIAYMYLCGAYPLAQAFSILAIIATIQTLIAFKPIKLQKQSSKVK